MTKEVDSVYCGTIGGSGQAKWLVVRCRRILENFWWNPRPLGPDAALPLAKSVTECLIPLSSAVWMNSWSRRMLRPHLKRVPSRTVSRCKCTLSRHRFGESSSCSQSWRVAVVDYSGQLSTLRLQTWDLGENGLCDSKLHVVPKYSTFVKQILYSYTVFCSNCCIPLLLSSASRHRIPSPDNILS